MLEIKGKEFFLDGKKFNIYAGAIHYFRTLPEYWEDRLLKLKKAGFNTVETYMCWNLHEPKKGEFDFSGMLDVVRFLKTAQDLGLYAIVRPGPYICAEWDFGGLPAWLLADDSMRVRCCYEPYLQHVTDFYKKIAELLVPMQITHGGNIIAMQVENEYGSYGNDKEYLSFIEKLMQDCGFDVQYFTSDGTQASMLTGGTLPHIFKVANFGSGVSGNFKKINEIQPDAPFMCGEFWNGWFDHWGEVHHSRPAATVIPELKAMLSSDANFSFYMFHGGTNFGFYSGANHIGKYQPTVTSYDDDALLNEWGGYTKKYHDVRKVLLAHQGLPKEELPAELKHQNIGKVTLTEKTPFIKNIENLGEKHSYIMPDYMEKFGQNFGFILYRHELKGRYQAQKLFFDGLHDRAYVFLDGKYVGKAYRNDRNPSVSLPAIENGALIEVLVEGMGRVNYGPELLDRKGVRQIRMDNQLLSHWEIYTLPLTNVDKIKFDNADGLPAFLKGTFKTESKADCFVHLKGFTKGYVFINGFNLGRYWKIGPQQSIYLPGVLLKEENEIIVLELENYKKPEIEITDKHIITTNPIKRLFTKA